MALPGREPWSSIHALHDGVSQSPHKRSWVSFQLIRKAQLAVFALGGVGTSATGEERSGALFLSVCWKQFFRAHAKLFARLWIGRRHLIEIPFNPMSRGNSWVMRGTSFNFTRESPMAVHSR